MERWPAHSWCSRLTQVQAPSLTVLYFSIALRDITVSQCCVVNDAYIMILGQQGNGEYAWRECKEIKNKYIGKNSNKNDEKKNGHGGACP